MSTVTELVTRSMRRLKLLAPGEDPSNKQLSDATDKLNSMIASWAGKGITVANDLPLGAEHDKAVIALLAMDMAPDYGIDPPPMLVSDARSGWQQLCGAFWRVPNAQYDPALLASPTQGYIEPIIATTNSPIQWKPTSEYVIGDIVAYRGAVYQCITAGTSAVTYGPTEKDASVTDGTVIWEFMGTL
jgi:hypothetical protein